MDLKKEIGNKLKLARAHKGKLIGRKYTGQMLADELRVSRGFIGDMESGRTPIPDDLKEKIIKICSLPNNYFDMKLFSKVELSKDNENNSDDFKISEKGAGYFVPLKETEFVNIPVVGIVRAGEPILAVQNIESYLSLPKSMFDSDKEYFGLKVKGDSMNLEFKEGTALIIEKTPCLNNGDIGVVLIDGLEATVKKVVQEQNLITLIPMSSNPIYKEKTYDIDLDSIKIVGKVKHAIKSY
jgi:repressor LexA